MIQRPMATPTAGSTQVQPVSEMTMAPMMTPTDPTVSASTSR